MREELTGVANSAEKPEEVGNPGGLERFVIEFAELCHDSLDDWSPWAGRLCMLIIVTAVGIAMIARATRA